VICHSFFTAVENVTRASKVLNVEYERVKKCSACVRPPLHCSQLAQTAGRYSKLHILDLSLDGPEAFVQFVQHHIRNYSMSSSSKKQYRSSQFTDLFSFLTKSQSKVETVSQLAASTPALKLEPAPSLTLEPESAKSFAKWSLTFGIAQVDSKDKFERILTFEGATQRFTMKCAEAAVHVMRLLFPLPVAIVSTDSTVKQKDLVPETIFNFLNAVKPFYVWSMQQGEDKNGKEGEDKNSKDDNITFEIHVHIASKAADGKKDASKVADVEKQNRSIKCIFRKLGGIPVDQMQVAISNILHREYGVVPVVFAKMMNSGSASDCSNFIHRISNSCLQSSKMLLITEPMQPSVPQRAELFLLEQSLDCTILYNEVVADFFIGMKEELQQRIHGEDVDELCRSACERIKRSSAASLPLHFHKMEPKTLDRLVRYLPEQFLRRSLVSGEDDPKPVGAFEHDFDFPVFTSVKDARKGSAKDDWMKYWEYLFLNCGDSRPYAPCWDPIALQDKARKVFRAISSRINEDKKSFELGGADCTPPHLLRHLYQRFRCFIVEDMLLHLEEIQELRGYSDREVEALMRRFERAIKKVFYFLMCCKRILFCRKCITKCSLVADENADQAYQQQYEIYALKCSMCESVPQDGVLVYPKPVEQALKRLVHKQEEKDEKKKEEKGPGGSLQKEKEKEKEKMVILKRFCFQWFMKVGLNLKKACSTSLLRHHGDPFFTSSLEIILGSTVEKNKSINLSHSRSKLSVPYLQNDVEERSRLRKIFLEVVEICRSGMVIVQMDDEATRTTMLAEAMIGIVVMAEQVNRVVAECDSLKTGCSTYEAFPKLDVPGQIVTPMSHLMVAAVEGNVRKASAYIAGADISYIFHRYQDPDRSDFDKFQYKSCALHMALERGNADVANAIIERTSQLVHEGAFDEKNESNMILDGLFLGACFQHPLAAHSEDAHSEVPTSFMYLARYAMIEAMDKVIEILRYLKKPEQMQQELAFKMIRPADSNGMNALHYAVLSQSPQCVAWFVPYMHDFHICRSTSKLAFVPPMSRDRSHRFDVLKKSITGQKLFQFGYTKLTRMHPPTDFSDSDCRLVISEDWIQAYHYGTSSTTLVEDEKSPEHKEMSPYELALMLWRLMDIESMHTQEIVHNIQTNISTHFHARKKDGTDPGSKGVQKDGTEPRRFKNGQVAPVSDNYQSTAAIMPSVPDVQSSQVNDVEVASSTSDPNVKNSQDNDAKVASLDDSSPERLAEAYKQRSNSFFRILTSLEEAADAEVEIDAKKKKGLRQFLEYRNRRAISRLVFPVIAYLGYVVASTLMAFLMTNGLMDEPTKFTQGVINELQWGPQNGPQKNIKDIASYNDLTVFWGVLAGFLWSASPMDRPFGEALCLPS